MNTPKGARSKWSEVFEDSNLSMESLKARAINQHTNIGIDGIRSVCWKIYLSCLPSLEIAPWPFAMNKERTKYEDLRRKYIRAIGSGEDQEPDLEVNNPLSLAEDSPWQQFFVDSELKKIIKQDVERTFPDNDFFRSEKVQEQLGDILFIYCKIHHEVSYRQGMHELAAYFLWVVSNESMDITAEGNLETSDPLFEVMKSVLDSNYIEHDTFALFSSLMSRAKPWYEFSDDGFGGRKLPKPNSTVQTQIFGKSETPEAPAAKQTPVIEWSERIFFYLEKVDNELFTHLKNLEIQPQLFGIRWFRLLFGREFPMEVVLNLWDGIFAIDPSLNIVIFIGLAMLLKIRDELLEQDFSGCLHKLMRYPEVKDTHLFISQGLRLQKSPTAAGGLEIIRQNHTLAGKPLPPLPSTEQASSPDYHSSNSPHSSQHYTTQQKHPSYQSHAHPDHARSNIFPSNGVLSQHLPPAALDAIKPVAEGFVHVTKNVLESKGGAALNKAIHDMKKNTQSYIRKANTVPPLPAAPSFPPMFDQAISSTGRLAASSRPAPSPSTQLPTSQSRSTSQLVSCSDKDLRSQLGQIVAKAIVILESELSTKAEAAEKTPKPTTKEAMAAIFGLEHVRDNLLGLTKELDPLVIESKMLDSPPKPMGQQPHKHVPQDTQIISKNAELQGPTIHAPQTTQTVNLSSPSRTVATHAVSANTNYPRAGGVQCTDARNSLEGTNLPRNASHGVSSGLEYRFDAGGEVYSGSGSGSGHRSESGTGSANSSPSLAPVRASTPIKQSQPFSFDDLLNDTSDSTPTSRSRHQGKDRVAGVARSGDTPSNVKSPRSSLAHSQFSWILNDDNAEGGGAGGPASQPGSMLSSSLSSSSNSSMTKHAMSGVVGSGLSSTSNGGGHNHPRPAAEIFSPLNSSSRMKLDPLAGNVSKRSTSFGRSADISSGAGGKVQSLDDDDPLRVHS